MKYSNIKHHRKQFVEKWSNCVLCSEQAIQRIAMHTDLENLLYATNKPPAPKLRVQNVVCVGEAAVGKNNQQLGNGTWRCPDELSERNSNCDMKILYTHFTAANSAQNPYTNPNITVLLTCTFDAQRDQVYQVSIRRSELSN